MEAQPEARKGKRRGRMAGMRRQLINQFNTVKTHHRYLVAGITDRQLQCLTECKLDLKDKGNL